MNVDSTSRQLFAAAVATMSWITAPEVRAESAAQTPSNPHALFSSPSLLYSTTFGGGTGEARDVAVDTAGNTIIAGNTTERFSFPLINAADADAGSQGEEGFVAKINAAGDDLVFSTYLGGDGDDWITSIDVDADGNVYVVGVTATADFPTTAGSLQPSVGNTADGFTTDGFVVKLDPLGNLLWSTYLGGDDTDEAHGIKVTANGTAYVAGTAKSKDFPTVDAVQGSCSLGVADSCQDAFVARLAAGGDSLLFSTYLGGNSLVESACSVDVDTDGNVFVVGHHISDGFPFKDGFQESYEGGFDLFVAKFAPGGGSLDWASGLGGSGNEALCDPRNRGPTIALDGQGDAFVATLTSSNDLPANGGFQDSNGGATDGYLAKITSEGTFEWGTYLGGSNSESITEVAVLPGGKPVVVGWSTSSAFPQTDDALEEADCPTSPISFCIGDVFVAAVTADGATLEFSTLLGGSDFEMANGVAVADNGTLHVAGFTNTELWPLVDALPPAYLGSGGMQAFTVRIGDAAAPIPGDVNGDGAVTASDALAGLGAALGTTQCLPCVCDLNGDGSISATDALIILNLAVSIPVATNPPAC